MHAFYLFVMIFFISPAVAHARPQIDVAFVVDSTGSMGPYIQQARARIRSISHDLSTGHPTPFVRFALVRYRDIGSSFVTQKKDFTERVENMATWLNDTVPKGGGDRPEAALEGMAVAINELSWSKASDVIRLIYLVGDAPPKFKAGGLTVRAVAQQALRKGIVIHAIACGGLVMRGLQHFEGLARLSEGRLFKLDDRRQTRLDSTGRAPSEGAPDLGGVVKRSARAYSGALGVRFTSHKTERSARSFNVVETESGSGLLGAHVRYVKDRTVWSDLWRAHVSVWRQPNVAVPDHNFTVEDIVVLGGDDKGVELVKAIDGEDGRLLIVRLTKGGVRFERLPSFEGPVELKWLEGDES